MQQSSFCVRTTRGGGAGWLGLLLFLSLLYVVSCLNRVTRFCAIYFARLFLLLLLLFFLLHTDVDDDDEI